MFALRIEHPKTRTGPYSYEVYSTLEEYEADLLEQIVSWHDSESGHPGMMEMSPVLEEQDTYYGVPMYKFYSGFEDSRQLQEWFTRDELETLRDIGFDLKLYNVKGRVLKDGKQIAFQKEKSILLDENRWDLAGLPDL